MPEKAILIFMFYFRIGKGCLTNRTPVDDTAAFVDPAFFIKAHENFFHCCRTALIHSKTFSFPVCRRTQFFQLIDNAAAIFFFPGPGIFHEFFPADLVFINALFFQHVCDFHFRSDGRMVGAGLPQGLISLHPFETDQDILHGVIQRMSHMKLPRYVWRRHHDGKGFFVWVYFSMKVAFVYPFLVEAIFDALWIIGFGQFVAHWYILLLCMKNVPCNFL